MVWMLVASVVVTTAFLIGVAWIVGLIWDRNHRPAPTPPCAHKWDVRTRVIAKPFSVGRAWGIPPELMERMLMGETSVILTCSVCGAIETRTVNGIPEKESE